MRKKPKCDCIRITTDVSEIFIDPTHIIMREEQSNNGTHQYGLLHARSILPGDKIKFFKGSPYRNVKRVTRLYDN